MADEKGIDKDKKEPEFEIEIEGDEPEKPKAKKKAKADVDLEIVDDTPEQDKGRKPSPPPEDVTEEELEAYSDKVRKRIQKFSKSYHDERRAKEEAQRERDELQRAAKQLLEENTSLKGSSAKNQTVLLDQAKQTVTAELELARKAYREAYETGEADKVLAAQEKLTSATIKADKVNNVKLPPIQEKKNPVKDEPSARPTDQKAVDWAKRNPWFHADEEMTGFAFGLHNKLIASGVDPKSDAYYEKLDTRMRQVFPDRFDDEEDDDPPPQKRKAEVVAPASRSTAPKKIRLTKSQVAVAKRLGVPLEEYAKQMVALERAE